ncbi:TPR-like protein [Mycena kentingensis (nom. inval.)]|nr:TPR-like protein [Mycena kentingensis (nom. inval.)]
MSSNNNIMQLKMEVLEDEAALLLNAIPNPEDFAVERAAHDDVPTNIDEPIPDAYDEDVAMSDVDEGTPPPFPVIDAKPKRVVLRDDSSGSDTESEDDSSSASSSSSDTSDSEDDTAAVKEEEDSRNSHIQDDSDGDFERLIENIRASGDGPATADGGMLAREWDFLVQENTLGTTRKKNNRPPPGSGPVLSAHTKSLIGEGNQAYVDGDLPRAIRIMLEVIRIEPRSPSAWAVLAQCYDEQKELTKGLQLRIMGAHLRMDAEEWDRLARQSKYALLPQSHKRCTVGKKGHQVNPNNIAGLWDCAMLAQEINDLRTARFAFLGILARYPHDLTILSLVRPILVTLGDLQTCTNLFKATFEHHKKLFPLGCGPSTSPSEEDIKPHLQELRDVPGGGFGEMEVLVLADLYTALGEHERAIEVVRTGIRWLQGRAEENWWDLCTDDREYDPKEPAIVRLLDEVNDIEAGMGDVAEGKVHADMILAEEMLDYAPLFTEIADAYFEVDRMPEARTIYERLGSCEATTSEDVLRKTALCMRAMGDLAAAAEVFEAVRKYDPTNNQLKMDLAEIYEILEEPRKALDLVYEVMDSRRRRPRENPTQDDADADRVPPLIGEKQKPPPPKTMSQMKRLCKPPRLSHAELRALETKKEEEAVAAYARVRELWAGMKAGEEAAVIEWLVAAKKSLLRRSARRGGCFSTSRVYRGMFPVRRTKKRVREEEEEEEQNRIVNRLQLDIAHEVNSRQKNKGLYEASDVFRGIKTDEWLQLFLQYAALLTQRGEYDEGEEVLRHLLVSSAYQQPVYQNRIRLGLVACAAAVGKMPVVVEQIRKIHTAHQWQNEPLRIFVAALSGAGNSAAAADAFLNSPFQKYLHREMLLADAAANRPQEVVWSTSHRRFSVNSGCAAGVDVALCSEDEDEEVVIPDKDKTMKKQRLPDIARSEKNYQSAIYYLLMAHDQCPEDPAIALSLAIASLGRASQRQCDNRQHLVAQAMAFLSRYREHRGATGEHATSCEIEF